MSINIAKVVYILIILLKDTEASPKLLELFQQPGEHLLAQRKTTADRITQMGYPCEQHDVLTEDGYIITLFRIPFSSKNVTSPFVRYRPKVLLQHGLFGTSDLWILSGSENSLSFLLADQGYDVWLGNTRGNLYGRKHRNLNITDRKFWRFSWHEIGYYDLAHMIDYIVAHNDESKGSSLHYIGHSQGTTVLMVLLSLKPEYQRKLKTINLMAPVVRLDHSEDRLLKALTPYLGYHNILAEGLSSQEFMPFNELFNRLAYSVCQIEIGPMKVFCSPMAFMIEGSFDRKNQSALYVCMESHPGGISTEQLLHFMQLRHSSIFRQYDFGETENLRRYNQLQPPSYPLQNIHKMLHVWYGDSDLIASAIDVMNLVNDFSNIRFHRIPDTLWTHGDFLFALNVREYVYEPIIHLINDYEWNKIVKI